MLLTGSAVERGNLQLGSLSSSQFLPLVKTQYWTLGLASIPELTKAGGFSDCWHLMMSLSNYWFTKLTKFRLQGLEMTETDVRESAQKPLLNNQTATVGGNNKWAFGKGLIFNFHIFYESLRNAKKIRKSSISKSSSRLPPGHSPFQCWWVKPGHAQTWVSDGQWHLAVTMRRQQQREMSRNWVC